MVCNNAGVLFFEDEGTHSDEIISINLVGSLCPFLLSLAQLVLLALGKCVNYQCSYLKPYIMQREVTYAHTRSYI